MIIGILFAGFYIKIGSLPIVADWVPYFSLFRWGFEVLLYFSTSEEFSSVRRIFKVF